MNFRGGQFSEKEPISQSVRDALNNYISRYGLPSQILLETGMLPKELPLPDGMNIVVRSVSLPKNIFLVGDLSDISYT